MWPTDAWRVNGGTEVTPRPLLLPSDADRANVVSVDEGMRLAEVLTVMGVITATGSRFWLEGGWGVDALVGRQTRPHRDLDVDLDGAMEREVIDVLGAVGYAVETDWRPNRVELLAPGRGWVDLHPLVVDASGDARQAALGGGWHHFRREWFTTGRLGGREVPCVSAAAQRLFHSGYQLRDVDMLDLAQLDLLERTSG